MREMVWLMKARRWAQNPPSMRRVIFVFSIIAVAVAIFALDHFGVWPEALTLDRMPRRPSP